MTAIPAAGATPRVTCQLGIGSAQVDVGRSGLRHLSPSEDYIGHPQIAVMGHLGLVYLATQVFVVDALLAVLSLLAARHDAG